MALKDQIAQLIEPALHQADYFLEDINIATPGQHRIITIIVDGESALNLDQVTVATKLISELLDEAAFMGESAFTLEVTSPGVDRPLTLPRHFIKNLTRLIKVTKNDGEVITGRATAASDLELTLEVAAKKETVERVISYSDIKRATVEIEFNRKDEM